MFDRLRSFFRIRRQEREREIFRFWDGVSERGVDPIRTLRGMMSHPTFDAGTHIDLALAGDEQATAICVNAVRDIFGVDVWNEQNGVQTGLTDKESLTLLFAFGDYMEGLKKNTNGQATLPELTEREQLDRLATKYASDCGSTSPEPKHGEPPAY